MEIDFLIKLGALSLARMEGSGFGIVAENDLVIFDRKMSEIGRPDSYPMISPKWHDFASDDAFGLMIVHQRQLIGGAAARVIRLGSDTLADHWESSYRRMYQGEGDPIESRVEAAGEITGNVVYQGGLFLHSEWRGGRVNIPAFMHYLHVTCTLKWHPNWIYGFMRLNGVDRAPLYGFTRQHLAAHRWLRSVEGRSDTECLVAVTGREIAERAEYYTRNPSEFAPQTGKQ